MHIHYYIIAQRVYIYLFIITVHQSTTVLYFILYYYYFI